MKKTCLILLLSLLPAMAQFANLGVMEITNSLVWKDRNTNRTDIAGFNLHVLRRVIIKTNNSPTIITNFLLEAKVFTETNRIDGPLAMTNNLSGWKYIYLTAVTTNEVESNPSVTNLVMFRNNVPLAPHNVQFLQVVTAMATNQLPIFPPGQ